MFYAIIQLFTIYQITYTKRFRPLSGHLQRFTKSKLNKHNYINPLH